MDEPKPQKSLSAPCKRPYNLRKRLQLSNGKRTAILLSARKLLESNGFLQLTMESLAKESGVTRQTIHNLFGTKSEVLEALFDRMAMAGGMERMREVMQQTDPEVMLLAFVDVFTGFWTRDRMLIRRIHGIAAIDPEFGEVVAARNKRRQMAATRIIDQLGKRKQDSGQSEQEASQQVATLYSLTSFEFFDALAESTGDAAAAAALVSSIAKKLLLA